MRSEHYFTQEAKYLSELMELSVKRDSSVSIVTRLDDPGF